MTDEPKKTGKLQGKPYTVGRGKPPIETQFKKNDGDKKDPKINRLGRKIHGKDMLRKEWESIWAEIMFDDKGKPIIDDVTGKALTRLKAQMRAMTTSTNIRKVELAMAYTFGKPKEELDLSNSDGTLKPAEMKPSEIAERVAALLKKNNDTNSD